MAKGVQIPVTIGFDRHKTIGMLRIDADQLPKTAGYVFAIGGSVLHDKTFELQEISVLSDKDFAKVLESKKGGK